MCIRSTHTEYICTHKSEIPQKFNRIFQEKKNNVLRSNVFQPCVIVFSLDTAPDICSKHQIDIPDSVYCLNSHMITKNSSLFSSKFCSIWQLI